MFNKNVQSEEFITLLLDETPLIDVRAPVEFDQGSLPGAVNLPLLNDDERALIGTLYKQQGSEAAVRRGFELVSGHIKETRLTAWMKYIKANPKAVLYCFRGGKRSQITQQWLKEVGIDRPLIVGGYKKVRQFLISSIDQFSKEKEILVLSGPTGSGKTSLIHSLQSIYPTLDLEGLARHRGSAFGALNVQQPSQVDFENHLAVKFLRLNDATQRTLVEDESSLIGRSKIPASFFLRMRDSPVIWLDEPLEVRVGNIFTDYIFNSAIGRAAENPQMQAEACLTFAKYRKSLIAIQRRLGGLRTQEVLADIEKSEQDFLQRNNLESNKVWIEKLLVYYYDPRYLASLERRQVEVEFKGSYAESVKYLQSQLQRSL